MTGRTTFARFSVEHEVRNAGTTIPAAPAAAAVPRKLLLEMDDFFMMITVGFSKIVFYGLRLKVMGVAICDVRVAN
jgi:hypothetical protein